MISNMQCSKIKYISDIVNGYSFKSELYTEGGIQVIRITNVFDGYIDTTDKRYYSISAKNEIGNAMLKENDILMSLTGNVGLVGKISTEMLPAGLNQRVGCIRVKQNKNLLNDYLYYWFRNDNFQNASIIYSNGSAQLNMSTDWLKNQRIFFPNIEKQKKIINYLDEKVKSIDLLIASTKEQIEVLKKYKYNLITEKIKFGIKQNSKKNCNVEWINSMNANFNIGIIKHDFTLHGRIGWQGLTTNDYKEQGPYLITGTDFENGLVNWGNCVHITEQRYNEDINIHVKENDLLITKDGTVGKVAVAFNCPEKTSLNSGIMLIKPKSKSCLTVFLKYVLESDVFWNWYYFSQRGNATIMHLYQDQFGYFKYPLPPLDEQKEIVQFLDNKCSKIDELIQINNEKLAEFEKLKKSIIYECVYGKKEVQ